MEFIGCIEIDQRNFSVYQNGTSFVVQKYINGQKVDGATRSFTWVEFEHFLEQLPVSKNSFKLNLKL